MGPDRIQPSRALSIAARWCSRKVMPRRSANCCAGLVIARHVLAALAAQGADKFRLIGEVVAAIMQVHAVAVARQGDIGPWLSMPGVASTCARSTVMPCALWIVAA
jgi:hypothetical protein